MLHDRNARHWLEVIDRVKARRLVKAGVDCLSAVNCHHPDTTVLGRGLCNPRRANVTARTGAVFYNHVRSTKKLRQAGRNGTSHHIIGSTCVLRNQQGEGLWHGSLSKNGQAGCQRCECQASCNMAAAGVDEVHGESPVQFLVSRF